MGNELCVASGGCPNKVLKDPPVSQRGPPQVFLSHRWTFSWSTTLRSHFCWTSTKIARGIVTTRVGRSSLERSWKDRNLLGNFLRSRAQLFQPLAGKGQQLRLVERSIMRMRRWD